MTFEEINLAFRMIAQGRPHQDAAQKLAEALAVVLATPEERLAMVVQDQIALPVVSLPLEVKPVQSEVTANAPAPDKPKRGRPPKPKVSNGADERGRPSTVSE